MLGWEGDLISRDVGLLSAHRNYIVAHNMQLYQGTKLSPFFFLNIIYLVHLTFALISFGLLTLIKTLFL